MLFRRGNGTEESAESWDVEMNFFNFSPRNNLDSRQ